MIEARLAQANGRLKAANVGVTIEVKGNRLYLRSTFPPKPSSKQKTSYQQRLPLGVHANPAGLKVAEAEARKVGALLDCKEFSWNPYLKVQSNVPQTCQEWIEKLKAKHYQEGKTETSWKGDYWKIYKLLPAEKPLTVEVLEQCVDSTKPNTKTRKRACMALGRLAKFSGLDFDPAALAGNYSPDRVSPRDLPDDRLIAELFCQLVNPNWRWVYGVMATYGIRNHEAFRLDLDELRAGNPILRVLDETKTGYREIWPCYPEWVQAFEVAKVGLPNINLDRTNERIGHSVTEYLSPKLPFSPYDLRHAWAVRTLEFGWPTELAAAQMGHSVAVHNRTYHRWITAKHHQRMYDLLVLRPDRPMAPTV
jgi:integrase